MWLYASSLPYPSPITWLQRVIRLVSKTSSSWYWQSPKLHEFLLDHAKNLGKTYKLQLINKEVVVTVDPVLIRQLLYAPSRVDDNTKCDRHKTGGDSKNVFPGNCENLSQKCSKCTVRHPPGRSANGSTDDSIWMDGTYDLEHCSFTNMTDIARLLDPSIPPENILSQLLIYDDKEGLVDLPPPHSRDEITTTITAAANQVEKATQGVMNGSVIDCEQSVMALEYPEGNKEDCRKEKCVGVHGAIVEDKDMMKSGDRIVVDRFYGGQIKGLVLLKRNNKQCDRNNKLSDDDSSSFDCFDRSLRDRTLSLLRDVNLLSDDGRASSNYASCPTEIVKPLQLLVSSVIGEVIFGLRQRKLPSIASSAHVMCTPCHTKVSLPNVDTTIIEGLPISSTSHLPQRVVPPSLLPAQPTVFDANHSTTSPYAIMSGYMHYRHGRCITKDNVDWLYGEIHNVVNDMTRLRYLPSWWKKVSFSCEWRNMFAWSTLFWRSKDVTDFLEEYYRKRKHDIEEGGVCSLRDLREHCRKQGLVCIPAMDAVILSSHQRFKETYNRPGHDDIQSLTNRQSVAVLLRGFISYVGFISNSICFALQELGLHPEIQDKARGEIVKTGHQKKNIVDGRCGNCVDNCPYLMAVIKETFRLHPSSRAIWRTNLTKTEVGGVPVEAGTHFLIPQFVLGRLHSSWANPPADHFEPDRWLQHAGEGCMLGS
eukprot:GHVQ01013631.1.p1 GENE.GHVQ01013631.1~~GHVQ01013631.1.p1  ORF type:complete len:706 (+),score=90.94 GHVQ01013631.1:275-2392(+)